MAVAGGCEDRRARPPDPADAGLPERPARTYRQTLAAIGKRRDRLRARLRAAGSAREKAKVLAEAGKVLAGSVGDEVFPHWIGTKWDFNGTTQTPGEGRIACGYFVSTVLRDVGFKVERVRLAQQAAERIIKSLTSEQHIRRFRNVSLAAFVAAVRSWGPGLYVVGLDYHVGFILDTSKHVLFVHSTSASPGAVVAEPAGDSSVLAASKYRVIGRISADDTLLAKWLIGTHVKTR